jgi:putative hydrolase of the HAD superfamily
MKIFFDVDGVLIHGWHARPERRRRWDATLKDDLGVDAATFQETFFATPDGTFQSIMHACVAGKRDLKEALACALSSLGYAGSVDAFAAYWFEKDSNLDYDLLKVVKRIARYPEAELYVVTGQEHYRAAYLWNTVGLRENFKDILYSARIGHLKGTMPFFAGINAMLAIAESERPLFFDDQEAVVTLAREAGWDACVFEDVSTVLTHPRLQPLLASPP